MKEWFNDTMKNEIYNKKIKGDNMKKIILITCLFLALPIMAFAHTTVSTSIPSNGEVITEELRELNVEFSGNIENQATLTLVNEQEEITIDNVSVEGKKIIGILPSPLVNGTYTLTWKVASTDGHIMTGDIPFTVDIPEIEKETEVQEKTEQTLETDENSENESNPSTEENTNLDNTQEAETEKDNSSLISTTSIVVLIVLLAVGVWVLFRKKR
jgi:methionine-rich copper-binding protein CopC